MTENGKNTYNDPQYGSDHDEKDVHGFNFWIHIWCPIGILSNLFMIYWALFWEH